MSSGFGRGSSPAAPPERLIDVDEGVLIDQAGDRHAADGGERGRTWGEGNGRWQRLGRSAPKICRKSWAPGCGARKSPSFTACVISGGKRPAAADRRNSHSWVMCLVGHAVMRADHGQALDL